MFNNLWQSLRPSYHPLNRIELSAEDLLDNYRCLSSLAEKLKVAPVLKSNAYGHGIVEIAKILDCLKAPFFCVDSLYEAYQLYNEGIKTPILLMGYIHPDSLKVKKLPFSLAVFDLATLLAIKKYQPEVGVHLFVDTGMHREGILLTDLPEVVTLAKKLSLNIEGLMTHLAMADQPEERDTQKQLASFQQAQRIVTGLGVSPKWIHLEASAGILHHSSYQGVLGNLARVGLSLYQLKPVLELKSTIAQIKKISKGEKVGYDFTFTAKKDMRMAVLPIGYHDGVDRRLSNQGYVLVKNIPCPIVGRVSMNVTVVDVSSVPDIEAGQEVIIYSHDPAQPNSIAAAANLCGTIPYELLIHLAPSTQRIII